MKNITGTTAAKDTLNTHLPDALLEVTETDTLLSTKHTTDGKDTHLSDALLEALLLVILRLQQFL